MKNLKYTLIVFLFLTSSCKKDWLNEKRDINLIVPTTLKDMRLILNYSVPLVNDSRALADLSADEYYVTNTNYSSLATAIERNAYIWAKDIYEGKSGIHEWDIPYNQIMIANTVLEGLEKITPSETDKVEYNDVKGSALFYRGRAYFNLAQIFCKPYQTGTAVTDLGVPLKLSSDINENPKRSTLQQTYEQILSDLSEAALLVRSTPAFKTDPSKAAAYAELARCYLYMGQYDKALIAAANSLANYKTLIDYNTLNTTAASPFAMFNDEVIIEQEIFPLYGIIVAPTGKIDLTLYNSYGTNDLRKVLYFKSNGDGTYGFKGQYSGLTSLFGGIATDEVYLMRAECYARAGDVSNAMGDLNTLLLKRYKTGTFTPLTAPDASSALRIILEERKKELLRRGLRWLDLRRLNLEPAFAVTLTRTVNNQTFTLPPNDPKYVFAIPDYIIQASGIQQNIR